MSNNHKILLSAGFLSLFPSSNFLSQFPLGTKCTQTSDHGITTLATEQIASLFEHFERGIQRPKRAAGKNRAEIGKWYENLGNFAICNNGVQEVALESSLECFAVDKSHQECSNLKMMSHLDEGQEEVDAVCDGVEGQVDTIGDGEEVVPYQSDSNGNEDMAAEVQDNICVEVHQATTLMHLGSLEKFKDQSGAEMGQGFIVDMFGVSEVIRRLMKMVMTGN